MIFHKLPELISVLLLVAPKIIDAVYHYRQWKCSAQDPSVPRSFYHYKLLHQRRVLGFPIIKHWPFWIVQFGVVAFLFAPLDGYGANL